MEPLICPGCKKGIFKMVRFRKGKGQAKDSARFECEECSYWERI